MRCRGPKVKSIVSLVALPPGYERHPPAPLFRTSKKSANARFIRFATMEVGISIHMNKTVHFDRRRAAQGASWKDISRQDLQDQRDGKKLRRQALHPGGASCHPVKRFSLFGEPSLYAPHGNQTKSDQIRPNPTTFPRGDGFPRLLRICLSKHIKSRHPRSP